MSAPSLSAWAFEQGQARGFQPSVRLTLLALAKLAKDKPSIPDLVDGTGLCRRSVINAIATIEKAGLVVVNRQDGSISTYRLQPQGGAITSAITSAIQPESGAKGGANGSAIAQPLEDTLFLSTSKKEPPLSPSVTSPPRGKPKLPFPKDWHPDEADLTFATIKCGIPQSQIGMTVRKIIDWHHVNGKLTADPKASWRTWCLKQVEWRERDRQKEVEAQKVVQSGAVPQSWRMGA